MDKMYFVIVLRAFVFFSTIFIVQFYFSKRLRNSLLQVNRSLDKKQLTKIIVAVIIALDLFPVFSQILNIYDVVNPENEFSLPKSFFIDYILRLPSWYSIIIVVQVVLLFIPLDLLLIVVKKLRLDFYEKLSKPFSRFFLYITIFFAIYIPLRSYYEFVNVSVEKRIYDIKSQNRDLNGFKIAFISDIQADRFTNEKRVLNFINKLNSIEPDLVLAGGDFISGDSDYIPIVASLAGRINSNYGVFSCIGDHDFYGFKKKYWKSLDSVKRALEFYGVKMIDNGNVVLMINDSKIKITFLSNTYVKPFEESIFDSLINQNNDPQLKVIVTHQPDERIANRAKETGYHLYLTGHTHGGQVIFLFPFIDVTPVRLETKFLRGDFWFGDMLMIVNRGLGMSSMPIRYHSIPEISVIEIRTH